MHVTEDQFINELNIFGNEIRAGLSFYYSWLTLNDNVNRNKIALDKLNTAPVFWNSIQDALLSQSLIRLGRIFDNDANAHSINRLVRMIECNRDIFSLGALAARKSFLSAADLASYLSNCHPFSSADSRKLKTYVKAKKKIYQSNYAAVRNKLFAHKEVLDNEIKSQLLAKTNIRELQILLISLGQIHEAIWQLFHNGKKLTFRLQRYSVKEIGNQPSSKYQSANIQERLVYEIDEFFKLISS